jgi:hypothetical protein
MRIGIDFDNTIVSYEKVFHAAAISRGLLNGEVAKDKTSVRDHLRGEGKEQDWILLQGHVYGSCMADTQLYPGVERFIRAAREGGHEIRIISHKTRYPVMGPQYDLHDAARSFLHQRGFFLPDGAGLSECDVFFEVTKADKLGRIESEGCDLFIDDLPEFLFDPGFPPRVRRYLFDPHCQHAAVTGCDRLTSWGAALDQLFAAA